ncbi:ABC transporter ATP-binding protein [Pseudomonas putida]|uniref:ABC-type dipeptide transporter n=1 Tax=Pseudomonas putida TaxID=303 RepID=A0AA37RAN5_PSEPU|nr:ABC transporter ATP-binding protein [Pseudomonas putida]GLO15010.1 ABC transporter ATP-binding protein [Pseudomonas putida]GLO34807.1 ABC transporter ATP-binding protein [Pseudomonas putida]HDS0963709.1 ABC transporter ATP-binding protein [Pseudomonas putida]HDS0988969.1 ABC transporter ATP-binding protein [Pseudomonas putida]
MNAPLNVASEVLRVSDLRVELAGQVDVLAEVSFSLAAGEIVGLVGESGSGKTTLATALLRHARQGARIVGGHVTVAGQSLLELEGEALRLARGGLVGYVAQDPATALNPALRIGALLGETLLAHQPALPRDAVRQRVGETLLNVGLPDEDAFLRRFPHQLSGGQQQRVMLALAFVLKPKLIVLDEPTTALDVTTQAHVLQTLKRLCRGQGVAALYVTHDLAVVRGLVDRVMVMYAGRLVEVAGREALFRAPAHPYTRALLAAIPDIARRQPLQAIAGHAPAPGQRPDGCAFAPRCARRRAECSVIEPSLLAHTDSHQVACLVPEQENKALGEVPVEALAAPGDVLLEVQGLDVAYDRQVLFDVSLQVRQGECLALVGESGSGKTSLARAIAGLGENVQGQLRYAGQPLAFAARQRDARLRHQIQYVFQNPYRALNPRQTVGQTLSAPLTHFFGVRGAEARQRVEAVLARVSLPARVADLYPQGLSGGERQRVAIARALICEPKLLVCDEVTSALDVSVQASILALLRRLQGEGLTLLFVTHDLGVVRAIADRVLVLRQGRVVEQGGTGQVLDRPADAYTQNLVAHSPSLAGL